MIALTSKVIEIAARVLLNILVQQLNRTDENAVKPPYAMKKPVKRHGNALTLDLRSFQIVTPRYTQSDWTYKKMSIHCPGKSS
jgi:hypothetical protein